MGDELHLVDDLRRHRPANSQYLVEVLANKLLEVIGEDAHALQNQRAAEIQAPVQ